MSEKANYHLDNLFKQCDRDYVKVKIRQFLQNLSYKFNQNGCFCLQLFQIVSDYLSKNSDFYKNDNYKTVNFLFDNFLKNQNEDNLFSDFSQIIFKERSNSVFMPRFTDITDG